MCHALRVGSRSAFKHPRHLDKVVHFGMFFIMAIFLCSELHYQTRIRTHTIFWITVIFSFIFGGLIEILQMTYFQRGGEWGDLHADVLGAVAGWFALSRG